MKTAIHSKTIWTGVTVTLVSLAAIAMDIWALLDPEQLAVIDRVFGAGTTALVGIAMIVLRVVTTQPLGRSE